MKNTLDLYEEAKLTKFNERLSFGCKIIDSITGGLVSQGITEISGEAGAGKSQICMMLSLHCQLNGLSGGLSGSTAYLSCGEGEFPIRRLQQLAEFYEKQYGVSSYSLLAGVHIQKCYSTENLIETIGTIPKMCRENNVRLVIIDR